MTWQRSFMLLSYCSTNLPMNQLKIESYIYIYIFGVSGACLIVLIYDKCIH